jgi:CRP-like cAMP-binding protein
MEKPVLNGQRNRLLASLCEADFALLQPYLVPIQLNFRKKLQSSNRDVKDVYFIDSGLASVVAVVRGPHQEAEVAIVGYEGMTGLAVVLGAHRSPCEIFMQVEGHGQRVSAADLGSAMDKSSSLTRTLLLFTHTFLVQAGYSALANAKGSIEERLARWLLMAQDRIEAKELVLTHEFLALMLGVRRAGVTVALQHFEAKGLIFTGRGHILIQDRDGLEESANGLYGVPEAEYERLFPESALRAADGSMTEGGYATART